MTCIRGFVDPNNDKNHFIFGALFKDECWKYEWEKQTYFKLSDIHKQPSVGWHDCAYFEIKNKNKNKNNNNTQYVLIYGNTYNGIYCIYEMQNERWNDNAIKFNDLWFNNHEIMKDGKSKYGFGYHLSMITDIFEKNKIHVIGGNESGNKYGCFEFNEDVLLDVNLGIYKKKKHVCLVTFFFVVKLR